MKKKTKVCHACIMYLLLFYFVYLLLIEFVDSDTTPSQVQSDYLLVDKAKGASVPVLPGETCSVFNSCQSEWMNVWQENRFINIWMTEE